MLGYPFLNNEGSPPSTKFDLVPITDTKHEARTLLSHQNSLVRHRYHFLTEIKPGHQHHLLVWQHLAAHQNNHARVDRFIADHRVINLHIHLTR